MRNSKLLSCLLFVAAMAQSATTATGARAQTAPQVTPPPTAASSAEPAAPPPASPTPPTAAATEATPAAAAVDTPAPVPQVPTAAPAAPADSRAQCLLGNSRGVAEPDAMTAAGLVCESLREAGANIDPTPTTVVDPTATSAYRVELSPLGTILLLNLAFESPIGTKTDTRSMQLARLEEIPVAAPRIAKSLLSGEPLEKTAKMNTLVGAETQSYQKKYGEIAAGVGVFGFGAINTNVSTGYGIYGQLYYEVPEYALGVDLRLGGSDGAAGDASFTGISIGGRYFFGADDITPFVGGGFGVLWFEHVDDHDISGTAMPIDNYYDYDDYYGNYRHYEGSGVAAHAEVGVEFLRMHDVRFDVLLRADAPLFMLKNDNSTGSDKYVLPISLMGSFSFQ